MTATLRVFPLNKRVGKIRDVAQKMLDKRSDRHALSYREQVTKALSAQLDRAGVDASNRNAQLTAFWLEVRAEILRQTYRGSRPGGGAA